MPLNTVRMFSKSHFLFFFSFSSCLCPLFPSLYVSHTLSPALSPLPLPLFVAAGKLVSGKHCSLAQCVPGTMCVCVPEYECVSAVCQSTSLKHQLGTRTHNQNKLAALSMSPWVAARVQKCVCLCLCVCICMCVSTSVCKVLIGNPAY